MSGPPQQGGCRPPDRARRKPLLSCRLKLAIGTILLFTLPLLAQAGEEGGKKKKSVCFNNCSGHGSCHDFVCHCDVGYHGGDCSFGKCLV